MTTLVATQQPLELISMSEKPVRRSKRQPAVVADYEQDDDFHFVRKSKKVRVDEEMDKDEQKDKEKDKEKEEEKALPVRKSTRGRPATRLKQRQEEDVSNTVANTTTTTTTKRSTRRKQVQEVQQEEVQQQEEIQEEEEEQPPLKVARRTTARGGRAAKRSARASAADELEAGPEPEQDPEPDPEPEPRPKAKPKTKPKPAPKAKARGRPNGRAKEAPTQEPAPVPAPAPASIPIPIPTSTSTSTPKPAREERDDDNDDNDDDDNDDAMLLDPDEPAKIALPMSDTPVINRNKEMRKKGGASNRRSSLGTRGRRASSLIDSGHAAIPHREVDAGEFFKHIAAEGLPEPRRMKQLLMWCGERALAAKPGHGNPNSAAILGARAIQDQLLKDFASKSECSNWFDREDEVPQVPVVLQPNPRNVELDEKKAALEAKIKRLQEEKKSWLAIRKPPPEHPPLFTPDEAAASAAIALPDLDLLDPDDTRIRSFLADEANSAMALRGAAEARLRRVRAALEFEVDALADGVHKLEQRVRAAGRQADRVLALSSARLREREERDRRRAGTGEMPIMEVLRSLSGILPEGGG